MADPDLERKKLGDSHSSVDAAAEKEPENKGDGEWAEGWAKGWAEGGRAAVWGGSGEGRMEDMYSEWRGAEWAAGEGGGVGGDMGGSGG